jgi:hypothetical protein
LAPNRNSGNLLACELHFRPRLIAGVFCAFANPKRWLAQGIFAAIKTIKQQ